MKKCIFVILGLILIVALGFLVGFSMTTNKNEDYYTAYDSNESIQNEKIEVKSIEISTKEERTSPSTLIIYKTYFTKCKHYIKEYKDIDESLVNFTKQELQERCRDWRIDKFSSEEVEMLKEEKNFCGEHYRLKLENNNIIIYSVDENGLEIEYERTGITSEYLTSEDILKLTSGIYVYGKENLTSLIEDYE